MQTKTDTHPRTAATIAVAIALALTSLTLAACGGSSHSATASTNQSADTSAPPGTSGGPGGPGQSAGARQRFAKVRECLQKNGVTLPQRTPGQRPAPGGPASGQPGGANQTKLREAIKKCGGGAFSGRRRNFNSPAFRQSLAKFATCMRENGVKVPAPNTSGNGPVFDTKGIDTSSATFRNAESKCRGDLSGSFLARPGAGTPPPTSSN
jgi:hypothetical protein